MSNDKWEKLGLIRNTRLDKGWMFSGPSVPTPLLISEDVIRVFATFQDRDKIGRAGYVDLDAKNPMNVLNISEDPVLDIGQPGTFDDNGTMPITAIKDENDDLRLYYIGWQLSDKVRYFLFTGMAISKDNGSTFERYSKTPLLERSDKELIVRTAAHVMRDNGKWKVWYAGGDETIDVNGKITPSYDMRYLESDDGLKWGEHGKIIMKPQNEDEFGFGRPYVLKTHKGYEMYYSVRTKSKGYYIGYALSDDGINWNRHDEQAGITFCDDKDAWDSEMMAFTSICKTSYGTYMFYNGNNYGEAGFGVARLR